MNTLIRLWGLFIWAVCAPWFLCVGIDVISKELGGRAFPFVLHAWIGCFLIIAAIRWAAKDDSQ